MIPLFTSEQVRAADSYAINRLGIPGIVLMENAAINIFNAIMDNFSALSVADKIGIICGKGNNGGDGFAVARHFINNGFDVNIIALADEKELTGDALINYKITKRVVEEKISSSIIRFRNLKDLKSFQDCSLIIDAILGTGAKGNLAEPIKGIVTVMNGIDAFKVSIDIPTGLDVDKSTGENIFDAHLTVSLAEFKRGLFYSEGFAHSGKVVKGSIGIGSEYFDELEVNDYLVEPEDAFIGLPRKKKNIHKYSAGKVLVIAGSGKLPGASFFTANSVLKSGAGACFLAFPTSIKTLAQQKLDSAIVLPYDDNTDERLKPDNLEELHEKINWADVIAIGPGLGRERDTQEAVVEILSTYPDKKFVIDADAIFALKNMSSKKIILAGQILTPHHKEFADLLGISIRELQSNLLEKGKEFAVDHSCYLVLKGAPTIIFNPEVESFINSTGNAGMAKFGTGDVLTGVIPAFISQSENLEQSLISSVYIHSLAADLEMEDKTELGFTAVEIMNRIPYSIKFLGDSFK
ncbi:MAG: NAD(P)H-hydrate dehydratase [bacterium]